MLHRLGQGGFGTVYKAIDTRYGNHVAVKVLRGRSPSTLYRFKQEFRGLADLEHPNLVRLYELSSDGWFVVMEYVDGVDLLEHLTGRSRSRSAVTIDDGAIDETTADESSPSTDFTAVRETFGQLARGVMALHAAHKLHRDIKPPNILVERSGRVVLLDFGLVVAEDHDLHALLERGAGTPAYMAPEQLTSRSLTASSDWYAVGATLHAALTGAPPRQGWSLLDATASAGDAPEALVGLCRALLDPDPSRRPGGDDALRALGVAAAETRHAVRGNASLIEFVGREDELAALDAALASAGESRVLLRVRGISGVGKTALLDAWLIQATTRDPDLWVLRSRCLEHEHIPFKAVDGIVDELVARLVCEPADARGAVLPESASARELLERMFPVLASLRPTEFEGAPPAPESSSAERAHLTADPRVMRDRALAALHELFERVAARHRIVLCIDDAHWGDADSARALAELLRPSPEGLLLVVTQRPNSDPNALPTMLAQWLAHDPTGLVVRDLTLSELDPRTALRLARACLDAETRDVSQVADRIAQEAGGSPFFIRQLARELLDTTARGDVDEADTIALSDLLHRQLARLPPSVRRLVEVLSLAARPLSEDVAARAADVDASEVRAAIQAAERSRFIAGASVGGRQHLETGHARVREEVVRALDAGVARSYHLSLADSLIAAGQGEPEVLLPHFLGADDKVRATSAALDAARHADQAFAFERAAELYGLVLDLGVETVDRAATFERKGDALANAGRSAAAAEALEGAVAARDAACSPERSSEELRRERRTLQRRCGELWLRSGYVSKGAAILKDVLGELQIAMPASEKDALRTAAWRRLRLLVRGMEFTPRDERDVSPAALERLDAMWGVTTSLLMLRFLIADAVGLQHFLEALEAGEPTRVLRAFAVEISFEAIIGGSFLDRRCQRMLAQMDRVAGAFETPYFRAWSTMCRGMVGWAHGDWETAWRDCSDASAVYSGQSRGLMWELAVCDVFRLSAATYLGRFADLSAVVPESHRSARDRGDLYATANLAFYESFLLLARDQPDEAIRCMHASIEPFAHEEFLANRYGIVYAIVQGELYRGQPEVAWSLVERDWKAWETTGMLRAQCARVEARYLRARAAIAMLTAGGRALPSQLARRARRAIQEDTRMLARDGILPAAPLAFAVRAGVAHLDEKRDDVVQFLREAARGFDQCKMIVHAGAARHHLAQITQRATDVDAATSATRRLTSEGVVRPERMFHLAIPGFAP